MEQYKDTFARSASKTITYRVGSSVIMVMLATMMLNIPLVPAILFILKLSVAAIVFYIVHERIWASIFYKKQGAYETRVRSVVKTVSWRIFSFVAIAAITWLLSGASSKDSILFSVVSNALLLGFHYMHERIWNKSVWGKKPVLTPAV